MSKRYKYENDIFQTIIIAIGRMLWWIISLPFKGFKLGKIGNEISVQERNYITSKRLEIEKSLATENEIELKNALMEADKLVDHTMKIQGYAGQTFADRFRIVQENLSKDMNNGIWQGHRVRNQIVHESESKIVNQELREATEKLLKYIKLI